MNAQVAVVKCGDYDPLRVYQALRDALNLLGGLEEFIPPGSKVLVKPNLLMAKPPEAGITTHPELVRQVIRVLKGIGCRVLVGDSPSVWGKYIENVEEVYRVSGMNAVCAQEGAQLVVLEKRRMREKFPLAGVLDHCDCIVSIPKLKTHELMLMTGAIKNLFGLVSGTFKTELHKQYFEPQDFAKVLADIYRETRPALTLIDAIVAMEGDGPATSGRLCQPGLLLAGRDCVALDSVLARIIGIEPLEVLSTREACARGLGQADISKIEILGEKLDNLQVRPFLLPSTANKSRPAGALLNWLKRFVRYYPYCLRNHCVNCLACVKACPGKCITAAGQGVVFDYARCIACFCCQEACPASAIKVRKSILARVIGL